MRKEFGDIYYCIYTNENNVKCAEDNRIMLVERNLQYGSDVCIKNGYLDGRCSIFNALGELTQSALFVDDKIESRYSDTTQIVFGFYNPVMERVYVKLFFVGDGNSVIF